MQKKVADTIASINIEDVVKADNNHVAIILAFQRIIHVVEVLMLAEA